MEVSFSDEKEKAVLELGDKFYALAEEFGLSDDWAHKQLKKVEAELKKRTGFERQH